VLSIRGTAEVQRQRLGAGICPGRRAHLRSEYGPAYIASLPVDVPMARIAVHPEEVVLLDFETRLPGALVAIGLAPS